MAHRVLHLIHWLNRGGIETWLVNMLRTVARGDAQMDICCKGPRTGEMTDEARVLGAEVFHCPLRLPHRSFARQFRQLLRQERYDIAHIHTETFSGYPAAVARRCGVKVISSFHNLSFVSQTTASASFPKRLARHWYTAWSIRAAFRHSGLVTGCSQAVLRMLANDFGGAHAEKPRLLTYGVPTGVAATEDRRQTVREQLGLAPDAKVVINVAAFRLQKNHRGLVRVARHVLAREPRAVFVLVGDGPLRPAIEAEIHRRNLSDRIHVLGHRSDVPALLRAADLFFFPSEWEGLPVAVLEAQMTGLPVVGSNIGPLCEAVDEGKTAILCPLSGEGVMADAIVTLLRDDVRRRQMGSRARRFAMQRFSVEASAQTLLRLYDEVMATAQQGRPIPRPALTGHHAGD